MSQAGRKPHRHPLDDAILASRPGKPVPFEFVLDEIAPLSPVTRRMFSCFAVYVEDKIVLALRDTEKSAADNGIWLATTREHHESLRGEFPTMRSIRVLGKLPTQWQVLPADDPDFEAAAMRVCKLILARDPRIGKVPKTRSIRARTSPRKRRRGTGGGPSNVAQ